MVAGGNETGRCVAGGVLGIQLVVVAGVSLGSGMPLIAILALCTTALASVILTLVLLTARIGKRSHTSLNDCSFLLRRCPVCDLVLYREGKYCSECGSRIPLA